MHDPKVIRREQMIKRACAALRRLQNVTLAEQFRIAPVKAVCDHPKEYDRHCCANLSATLADGTTVFYRVSHVKRRHGRKRMWDIQRIKGLLILHIAMPLLEDFKYLVKRMAQSLRAFLNRRTDRDADDEVSPRFRNHRSHRSQFAHC